MTAMWKMKDVRLFAQESGFCPPYAGPLGL